MSVILSLLPVYLLGNLHCMGMCGPLVMFIGQHRYRNAYFLGRVAAFTIAGMIAGEIGAILQVAFHQFNIPALTSFLFGSLLILLAIAYFTGFRLRLGSFISSLMGKWSNKAATLMTQDHFFSVFLFGLCTILLPCGQSIMVLSASALTESVFIGGLNGAVFALLTSPSLWFAMQAKALLKSLRRYYYPLLGFFSLIVGILAICRGLAEMQFMPHLVLNPNAPAAMHIVLY